jgi:hypothetical protein
MKDTHSDNVNLTVGASLASPPNAVHVRARQASPLRAEDP